MIDVEAAQCAVAVEFVARVAPLISMRHFQSKDDPYIRRSR